MIVYQVAQGMDRDAFGFIFSGDSTCRIWMRVGINGLGLDHGYEKLPAVVK
jgi:hypothetical protein